MKGGIFEGLGSVDNTTKEKAKMSFLRSTKNGETGQEKRKGSEKRLQPQDRVVKSLKNTSIQYSILSVHITAIL